MDQIGPIYRRCLALLWETIYADQIARVKADPESASSKQLDGVIGRSTWPTISRSTRCSCSASPHDPTGGSIYPATWSAMLAARAEGVGACTSVMLFEADAVLDILGVPKDEGWLMSSCVTFGYPTGRWDVAPRVPCTR